MRTCAGCEVNIQLYVDGELIGEEREEFLFHVRNCIQCNRALHEAEAFSLRIRQARPLLTAPDTLRETVMRAMQRAERTPSKLQPALTTKSALSVWSSAAIAAMLTLTAGSLLVYQWHRQRDAGTMLKTAAFAHREIERHALPLDIVTDSSETLATWFQSRISFPFHMANAGIASDTTAEYKLTGGRLVAIGNEPVALVAFSLRDDVVTMLVGPERLMKAAGGTVFHSAGIALYSYNEGPLHLVTWNNRGLAYVLTSARSMGISQQCSSCHRDSAATSQLLANPDRAASASINTRVGGRPVATSNAAGQDRKSIPIYISSWAIPHPGKASARGINH